MDTTHRKIRQTQTTPLGDDLPRGLSLGDIKLLGQRCDQWMDWRKGKTPEPEWHKAKNKPKAGKKWGPYTANENGWYSLTPK